MQFDQHFWQKEFQITAEQFQIFQKLFDIFKSENQVHNLSAIREDSEIWIKHYYDSLLAKNFICGPRVIDLGSGGGFPLLPLSILKPEFKFYGVESVQKKCLSMEKFISKLQLTNIWILSERAEFLARRIDLRESFDCLTARAFAKFPVLLEIGLPFLKVDGLMIAFRGPEFESDDKLLIDKLGAKLVDIVKRVLPSGEERFLWLIKKQKKSSEKFPRKVGIPKKSPLHMKDL